MGRAWGATKSVLLIFKGVTMTRIMVQGFYQLCWGVTAFILRQADNGRYFRVIRPGDIVAIGRSNWWARLILWGGRGNEREMIALVPMKWWQLRRAQELSEDGRKKEARKYLERELGGKRGLILHPTADKQVGWWAAAEAAALNGVYLRDRAEFAIGESGFSLDSVKRVKKIRGLRLRSASGPKRILVEIHDGKVEDFNRQTGTATVDGGTFGLQWKTKLPGGKVVLKQLFLTPEADLDLVAEIIRCGPGESAKVLRRHHQPPVERGKISRLPAPRPAIRRVAGPTVVKRDQGWMRFNSLKELGERFG